MLSEYEAYSADRGDALVRQHLPLVKRIAQQLMVRLPSHIDIDDLIQVGLIGLLKAAEDHQRDSGATFATYATIRIRGAMLDELRTRDWLPRSVQRDLGRVAAAIEQAEQKHGRAPTDREIADQLEMELEDYRQLSGELACARIGQLDDIELPSDDEGPVEAVFDNAKREALVEAIKFLPEKEGLMLSLYYTEGLNLKEIGLVLNVSESRVSQIHGQAVARLRAKLSDWT
jgi:RNA polymerase sigma factor for flagellar operon FliA